MAIVSKDRELINAPPCSCHVPALQKYSPVNVAKRRREPGAGTAGYLWVTINTVTHYESINSMLCKHFYSLGGVGRSVNTRHPPQTSTVKTGGEFTTRRFELNQVMKSKARWARSDNNRASLK